MAQVSDYTSLIPPANANKPKFMALVAALCQPFVDIINFYESMVPGNFSLLSGVGGYGAGPLGETPLGGIPAGSAIGAQLDVIGQWVGIQRYVSILLNNWFSFDTPNLGWDEGVWWVPPESQSGVTRLDDTTYLALITAKIAWNNWDGTTPTFYAMLQGLFSPCTVAITDNLNNTISVTVTGTMPNQTLKLLATENLLPFIPVGVTVNYSFVS
jgi:Protein of unknown function (DUF2612)